MSAFEGAAPYYQTYRPGIPAEVAPVLVAAAREHGPAPRLLDLGTGTGLVVQALHQYFPSIVAVDPDKELLAEAAATLSDIEGLTLVNATAEDFRPDGGWTASLVTICRAFHWMDQERVLRHLDDIVADHGVVAIFGDNSFWAGTAEWQKEIRAVIQEFLGERRRAGNGVFTHHDRPYSEILAESPFSQVQEITVPVRRTWTIPAVFGYLYSTTFAARHLFGDHLPEFEHKLTTLLAGHSPDGMLTEDNEFLIRLGSRP